MILVGDKSLPWHTGITVREILAILEITHTSIIVSVNGEIVPREKWDVSYIPDNGKIRIAPIISGG